MSCDEEMESLCALHMYLINIRDEQMKNYLWNIIDSMNRKFFNQLKDIGFIPKDSNPKFGLDINHKYTWFFFMEPEWFWGPEGSYEAKE